MIQMLLSVHFVPLISLLMIRSLNKTLFHLIGYVFDATSIGIKGVHIFAKGVNETFSRSDGSYTLILPPG